MSGAIYTHYTLNDSFDRIAPSLVFALLIICRLIIFVQAKRREEKQIKLVQNLFDDINKKYCEKPDISNKKCI
jgi:hypothetical protein